MLIWGLVLVLVVAGLSAVTWVWAVRKPPPDPAAEGDAEPEAEVVEEPRTPTYVAIGNTDVNALFGSKEPFTESGWATLLHRALPEGTEFASFAQNIRTLKEANAEALTATVQLKPTLVTIWNVVGDSTGGTPLTSYLTELRSALDQLTEETEAQIILLTLPDITYLIQNQTDERKTLIRGGIEQWNRVIAEAATRYGSRIVTINPYKETPQILDPTTGNAYLADLIRNQLDSESVDQG